MIYLDNSATTYPKPECVYTALDNANRNMSFNAGRGSYLQSKKAFDTINLARKIIGDYISTSKEKVIFTSSATESLNLIISGLELNEGDNVYVSVFEHNAVMRTLYAQKGVNVHIIPMDKKTWKLDVSLLENCFAINKPKAIILSHISNVTGYEIPYKKVFELAMKYNPINILDCAQSYGILKPDIKNINYIVFAGHKSLYSSFGVAGFIKLKDDILMLKKFGGTGSDSLNLSMPDQIPQRYEAGSSNVVAISGLICGSQWVFEQNIAAHEYELSEYLILQLKKIDKVKIFLPDNEKTLGIVSIALIGYSADDIAEILFEEFEICVRAGYHCAPLVHEFIGSIEYNGTVRISIGAFNTKKDIDSLINAIKTL